MRTFIKLAVRILVRSFGVPPLKDPGFSTHLKGLSGVDEAICVKGYKSGDTKYTCVQALAELKEIESAVTSGDASPLDERQIRLVKWLTSYINEMLTHLTDPL